MLNLNHDQFAIARPAGTQKRGPVALDLASMIAILRQQWPLILAASLLCLGLAMLYLATATPKYTASARIMIDTRKNQLLQNQQVYSEQAIDASAVESQVEVLKSEGVALAAIKELKLGEDPEFVGSAGLLSKIFGGTEEKSEEDRDRGALARLMNGTTVKRIGLTYIIEVGYTALSPQKAAHVANGIVDAYMVSELDAKYQATRRASKWLQDRIAELRDQATKDERTLLNFKSSNNMVDTSRGLMSEQQLSDVNTQLVTARAATAEAKARRDRIQEIIKDNSELPDASVSDALRNDVITRLRAQYLDLQAREADWAVRYGVNHAATQNIRNQMREIRRSMLNELNRIAETYRSDYEISIARERSLQESLQGLVEQKTSSGDARVKLRDLESSAQTSRNMYDSFLQKSMEATQQQTFPVSEARVIASASEPSGKSSPKTVLIIAASIGVGLMLGIGGAVGRELLNKTFYTAMEVERSTGLECLGILPLVNRTPALGEDSEDEYVEPARYATGSPFSRFTETLRNVKVSADIARLSREVKTIGVVSSLPKEGKTTVAANLAQVIAHNGSRVLLIDADLRNPSLTRTLTPNAKVGLVEVLTGRASLDQAVLTDRIQKLHILPAVVPQRIPNTAEILSSSAMTHLLATVRQNYDYVIVDFAPIGPVVDVKAAGHLIDAFVVVVEWGKTTEDALLESLNSIEQFRPRMLGVVLNRADPSMLKRYELYKGRNYTQYYLEGPGKA